MAIAEIGLLLLFLMGRKKGASAAVASPVKEIPVSVSSDFGKAWRIRCEALLKRGQAGDRWSNRMATQLGNPEAGKAAARWIGIESGGRAIVSSSLAERGLAQVMKGSLKELGMNDADWTAMGDPKTTDDKHAELAAKIIVGEIGVVTRGGAKCPDPGWGPAIGPCILTKGDVTVNAIGVAKLRHGLPLLVKELREQGHLRTSILFTIRSALTGTIGNASPIALYKPSTTIQKYAVGQWKVTGDPAKDLLLRFMASAAVIALGDAAPAIGEKAIAPSDGGAA